MAELDFLGCGRRGGALEAAGLGAPLKKALLGRDVRYAPDRDFDTLHIRLDLTVDFRRRGVRGSCLTDLRAFRGGLKRLTFDAVGLKVRRASVDGRRVRHRLEDGRLVLELPRPLPEGRRAQALVEYSVEDPKAGLHFVYPRRHAPRNPVQVWSQSQPEDARHWFPCHDSPHQKATSELRVTVPRGFTAVSNGSLVSTASDARTETFHWRMSRPHSIYLISLAAGRFSRIEEEWDGIPILYYCERGREADARRGLGKTPSAMEFFSRLTGVRYPYEKYAQVAAAEYPGGMEHTTCTTQTDAVLIDEKAALDTDLDTLVAHELAHQWFGDMVTCRDWSHAWLNEGFATYCEVLFQEHDKGIDEADYELYRNALAYFDEDSRRYRRPIVCPSFKEPWTLFDRHLYEKGSWVLHMLSGELGRPLWRRAVGRYLEDFRDRSVETSDLIASLHDTTGLNLKPFFDQWVYGAGFPRLRVQYDWDPAARRACLWVLQTQEVSGESPAFRAPLEVRFSGRGWSKTFEERLSEREHLYRWRLPEEPLDVEVDPGHRLLKQASVRKPRRMWLRQLTSAERAWGRHEAARALARWPDETAAAALARAVRREPFWGAACEMASALGTMRIPAAYKALDGLMRHPHPKVRRSVAAAVAAQRRPQAAAALARLARRDPSLHVRAEACRGLGGLHDGPGHRRILERLVRERSYRDTVSAGALAGLAAGRSPRALAVLRREAFGPRAFPHRAHAVRGLSDYAPADARVVPWLCELLEGPDERLTLAVIAALGRAEDRRALAPLEKARKSPVMRVRVYAEEAITRIRAGVEARKAPTTSRPR